MLVIRRANIHFDFDTIDFALIITLDIQASLNRLAHEIEEIYRLGESERLRLNDILGIELPVVNDALIIYTVPVIKIAYLFPKINYKIKNERVIEDLHKRGYKITTNDD